MIRHAICDQAVGRNLLSWRANRMPISPLILPDEIINPIACFLESMRFFFLLPAPTSQSRCSSSLTHCGLFLWRAVLMWLNMVRSLFPICSEQAVRSIPVKGRGHTFFCRSATLYRITVMSFSANVRRWWIRKTARSSPLYFINMGISKGVLCIAVPYSSTKSGTGAKGEITAATASLSRQTSGLRHPAY